MSDYKQSIHRPIKVTAEMLLARRVRIDRMNPTPERPMYISISEVSDYKRCRVKWWWRYMCNLEANAEGALRNIGILVHDINRAWYDIPFAARTVRRMIKIAKRMIKAFSMTLTNKDRELVYAMCVGYAEWALSDNEYTDIAIGLGDSFPEKKFDLPLTKDGRIRLRGKIDNRFIPGRRGLKRTMAMQETKTKSAIQFDPFDISDQVTAYIWALKTEYPGYRRYVAYPTIARRQLPTKRVKNPLFGRTEIQREDDEIQIWLADIRNTAYDMLDAAIFATKEPSCNWSCDFTNPCMLRGDTKMLTHVLESQYHTITYNKKEKKA